VRLGLPGSEQGTTSRSWVVFIVGWMAGRIQDIDLDAIKVDYDVLFGNFEVADCAAGPLLDLLVLLCASDNFKGWLLAELDK
jgi:hypothetical protein